MRRAVVLLVFACIMIVCMIPFRTHAAGPRIRIVAQRTQQPISSSKDTRFVLNDNGVVTDIRTGLEWFVGPDRNTTWNKAKSWVEGLTVGGGGWRLPTSEELKGLYQEGVGRRNLSYLFKTTGGFVWSSETVGSSYAWGFCFQIGSAYWPLRTFSDTARGFAVRSGKR